MTLEEAQAFAKGWCEAWNGRDLERVIAHYAVEIEFHSPLARQLLGDACVVGIDALRAYWAKGLAMNPTLHFRLTDVLVGDSSLAVVYRDHHHRKVAETFTFDPTGKVSRASAFYGSAAVEGAVAI